MNLLRPAVVLFLILTVITGVLYPLAVTGIARAAFPRQADGSLILGKDGKPIGSSLLGQEFASGDPKAAAKWFWGRPSATGPVPYTSFNADKSTGSSGSNLAPTNPALLDNVKARLGALHAADEATGYARPVGQKVPVDRVTRQLRGVPHATINHHPGPTIARGGRTQIAPQQRMAQRRATIHHQYFSHTALGGLQITH